MGELADNGSGGSTRARGERVSVWACVGKKGEEQYQQKSRGYVVSGDL